LSALLSFGFWILCGDGCGRTPGSPSSDPFVFIVVMAFVFSLASVTLCRFFVLLSSSLSSLSSPSILPPCHATHLSPLSRLRPRSLVPAVSAIRRAASALCCFVVVVLDLCCCLLTSYCLLFSDCSSSHCWLCVSLVSRGHYSFWIA
jgi:hypothetical protein